VTDAVPHIHTKDTRRTAAVKIGGHYWKQSKK